jgi:hypothetical protein
MRKRGSFFLEIFEIVLMTLLISCSWGAKFMQLYDGPRVAENQEAILDEGNTTIGFISIDGRDYEERVRSDYGVGVQNLGRRGYHPFWCMLPGIHKIEAKVLISYIDKGVGKYSEPVYKDLRVSFEAIAGHKYAFDMRVVQGSRESYEFNLTRYESALVYWVVVDKTTKEIVAKVDVF